MYIYVYIYVYVYINKFDNATTFKLFQINIAWSVFTGLIN